MTYVVQDEKFPEDWPLWTFNPYARPTISTRTGAIFRLHPYPTKINYRSILPFILAHTSPGDTVYDSFAGTCSTGIAAAACAEPDVEAVKHLRLLADCEIKWGPRKAICLDIGFLPTFIGRTLVKRIDTADFKATFDRILNSVESRWNWMYQGRDPYGNWGTLRYTFFTELIRCGGCDSILRHLDLFVDFTNGDFRTESECPRCGHKIGAKSSIAVTEKVFDDLLGKERLAVKREPVLVFGKTGKKIWSRQVSDEDRQLLSKISQTELPPGSRPQLMLDRAGRWGEMYRSGYHQDITHLHHFYTRRNFIALSVLHEASKLFPAQLRDHYRLLISSYNAAHSTLMTRFVFKKGGSSPVVTSCQPGTLYIGGCPVEKNVFLGTRQKLKELLKASTKVQKWVPNIQVVTKAAQEPGLATESVDYIFTDPPFAENIQYSEINFLSEAWLGEYTDSRLETIVSGIQNKGIHDYENLLTLAFNENFRILKRGRFMTVIFHNKNAEVWNVLRRSIERAGFQIVNSSILDKLQSSFKQTTAGGAVKKDIIIAAHKPFIPVAPEQARVGTEPEEFIRLHLATVKTDESRERTSDYLFSRYVGFCLATRQDVPVDAEQFKEVLSSLAELRSGLWYLRPTPS